MDRFIEYLPLSEYLLSIRDENFKAFQSKLLPEIEKSRIIGIKTPQLRLMAKKMVSDGYAETFLKSLPHGYFEENNIHAFIIEQIKDYDRCISELNTFLPYVDNWATCDQMNPKILKKRPDELINTVDNWLISDKTYTVRFGIKTIMNCYLDANFDESVLKKVSRIGSDEYYINMMIAWFFATALAKQWQSSVTYIEQDILPSWIHNKTIQKATESYRIPEERKKYLKKLKRI